LVLRKAYYFWLLSKTFKLLKSITSFPEITVFGISGGLGISISVGFLLEIISCFISEVLDGFSNFTV